MSSEHGSMIVGIAHHGVHTALEAARRCVGGAARVVTSGDDAPRVAVVPSVRLLCVLSMHPIGMRSHAVVVDCLENLLRVPDVVLVDARHGERGWNPRPIHMGRLRSAVTTVPGSLRRVELVASTTVDEIIARACETGMLNSVLALARRLPDATARTSLHLQVVEHLCGKYTLATLRRRTVPDRPALVELHDEMCRALESERGLALGAAIRMTKLGVDVKSASRRTGADVFEINYLLAASEKAHGEKTTSSRTWK